MGEQTYSDGLDREVAERFGTRVAIQLERGNWERAHQVVDAAEREHRANAEEVDLETAWLAEIEIPTRLIGILEDHEIYRVRQLVALSRSDVMEFSGLSSASVARIERCLAAVGHSLRRE